MSRRSKVLAVLGTLALLLGILYDVLVLAPLTPSGCDFQVNLTEVRAKANELPGPKPSEIRVERVTTFKYPGAIVRTGGSWGKVPLDVYAYQLRFPTQTVVVDTAMSEPQSRSMKGEDYDAAAWQRVSRGLEQASAIYVTHEHGDHLGGAAARPEAGAVFQHLRLTRTQQAHLDRMAPLSMPATAKLEAIDVAPVQAVAPGVVLIQSPGHTPGSQLVYVQRQDGQELLLLGDVAWHNANVEQERLPAPLVNLVLHGDRQKNLCELVALHRLAQSAPNVPQMPGHDPAQMAELLRRGVVQAGFR